MTLPIALKSWAEDDILEAAKWYSEQQPDLGKRFSDAVYEKLIVINAFGRRESNYDVISRLSRSIKVGYSKVYS
ncbi:MAG: hypothetical protein ACK5RG_08980 [Cyclobacteriaceae bacterium]|jgi:hypothetical protein|nr:hypothetical protein [Flammeovirgaceae bacterium]